ncbi:MAG: acyltransferase [Thermoleophilaceae bacterium]
MRETILARLRRTRLWRRLRGFPNVERLSARGLQVGRNVYLGHGTVLDSGFLWLIEIGDDTTLSAGVRVLAHDSSTRKHTGYTILKRVSIGRRVYIGAGAIVLPGVTIGDDAVVGAGSVVTRDVAPGTVVAGNPARAIGETAALAARHRDAMQTAPRYPLRGWTVAGGITARGMREMRETLSRGTGYVR